MELFRVLTAMDVNLVGVKWDLSVLLTGFLGVAWFAAGLIGLMACQHFISWTSMARHHMPSHACDEQVAASCDHRGTARRVCRDVEPERGMTGGRQ